jgi:uncharacterized repeat protein (TIGR01451 family)
MLRYVFRRRLVTVALVALAASCAFWVVAAVADAPDVTNTTNYSNLGFAPNEASLVSVDYNPAGFGGQGTTTVTVKGGWAWPTHGTDCNTDRAGAGYAMVWNDPNDAGYKLGTSGFAVGSQNPHSFAGNTDANVVQPTPNANDPSNPADVKTVSSPSDFANWGGGCGKVSTGTVTGWKKKGSPPTSFSQGFWGPISHTYVGSPADLPPQICAVTYDVHAGTDADNKSDTGFGIPGSASEITSGTNATGGAANGYNKDNSVQSNGQTPAGDLCAPINFGSIELDKVWVGTPADTTLQIGSTAGASDVASTQITDGSPSGTGPQFVNAGTYFLSETGTSDGYTASDFTCTDDGSPTTVGANNSVTVNKGDTVVCSVTNTQNPNVTITKTADDANVSAGQSIGYTITVSNTGGSTAHNVAVSDTLPTGTASAWSIDTQSNAGLCSITTGTLSCGPTDLAAGDSFSVHIASTTSAENCGTYDNTASVTSDDGGSGKDEAVITCHEQAVHITKTPDDATVSAGDQIGYTITVSATGNSESNNVQVSDPLPTGTDGDWTIASQSVADLCSITSGTLTCPTSGTLGMAPGDSFTVHIVANTSAADCTTYDNTATVTSDNAGTDQAEAVITCQKPVIHITKKADSTAVSAGDAIGFTVTVNATGAGTAHNVQVNDPLPAGPSWSIDTQSNADLCSITSGTLSCGPTSLAAGGSFSVHITAATSKSECSTYHNTADVTTDNAGNGEASATITCTTPPPSGGGGAPPTIDLAITKSANPNPATVGGQITWTMVVTNNGPSNATGVTVSDPLPSEVSFVSASSTQGSCSFASGTVTCAIGSMVNGASVTVTVVTTLNATGTLVNTATVKGDQTETNTANNVASAPDVAQAAFVPPKKPTLVCSAINASPKLLYVGRNGTVILKVTKKGKAAGGVRVHLVGAGLNMKTGKSNSRGLIKVHVKPKKAGIVHFTAVSPQKSCRASRIGVTGVFTPPVTG